MKYNKLGLPEAAAKVDDRFAAIRKDPEKWFNAQTPARQASIRRKQADREWYGKALAEEVKICGILQAVTRI